MGDSVLFASAIAGHFVVLSAAVLLPLKLISVAVLGRALSGLALHPGPNFVAVSLRPSVMRPVHRSQVDDFNPVARSRRVAVYIINETSVPRNRFHVKGTLVLDFP